MSHEGVKAIALTEVFKSLSSERQRQYNVLQCLLAEPVMTVLFSCTANSRLALHLAQNHAHSFFHACAFAHFKIPMQSQLMEKGIFLNPQAATTAPTLTPKELFSAETPLLLKESRHQFSFVVRMSKSERVVINKLSRDFGESLVTILTKSLRVYRAIAEAANQGGSLVMTATKGSSPFGGEASHNDILLTPGEQVVQLRKPPGASAYLTNNSPPDIDNDTIPGNDTLNGRTTTCFAVETINNHDINEAIIAVRDQFADNDLTPISLNPLYITPAKGSKTEKITLKIDSSFAERLQALEQKTGLKKSVIVRDSVQLYDFIKRKFNDNNVSFFIGGTPIVSI
jgi:hypothetical protein